MACIGEPVSWLRLEAFQLGAADPQIDAHLGACEACRGCLAEIRNDVVALPPLVVPVKRRRWTWIAPAMALAAAAIVLLVLRTRPGEPDPQREDVATIKGVGEVLLGTVRERDGAIAVDASTFRRGDRWKVVVTCPPAAATWVDVAVVEVGGSTAAHPLAPTRVACGNRIVVPGAFTLDGGANRVCVRLAADAAPARDAPRPGDMACVTIRPE